MHLGWVKEQSLTPQRYYLFLNLQIKSEVFLRFFTKKEGRHSCHHDISLPKKITHTINPKHNLTTHQKNE